MTQEASNGKKTYLAFKIGPVQSFIEAARTSRDLHSGSFLLSWFAAKAIVELERVGWKVTSPAAAENPLVRFLKSSSGNAPLSATVPCLPNTITACRDGDDVASAEAAGTAIVKHLNGEWAHIATAVRQELKKNLNDHIGWDNPWDSQVAGFFEFSFGIGTDANSANQHRELKRDIGHFPPFVSFANAVAPPKCTLLGSYEALGPEGRFEDFWGTTAAQGGGEGQDRTIQRVKLDGLRVRGGERLCAISLIKRFAWPCYFKQELHVDTRILRIRDTATVAASIWLEEAEIDPDDYEEWNGQWLHGGKKWERGDEPPKNLQADLKDAEEEIGKPPPTYYAILMLDGDKMGDLFSNATPEIAAKISGALAQFASKSVPTLVDDHLGELLYAGGDDVLAFFPAETALTAAKKIKSALSEKLIAASGKEVTASAGLAIVHHKEDLRFALQQARDAEKAAKDAGRDRLAIRVCKRSGEHSTVVAQWSALDAVTNLHEEFLKNGASDRWVHKLRREAEVLKELPSDAIRAEAKRLINRAQHDDKAQAKATNERLVAQVDAIFDEVLTESNTALKASTSERELGKVEEVALIAQTASFLARGYDSRGGAS